VNEKSYQYAIPQSQNSERNGMNISPEPHLPNFDKQNDKLSG
jgi:hypothetical protein